MLTTVKYYSTVPCGLYYKHMTIVNDDSSIVSEQSFQLIDDARGIIYDRRMFIRQSPGQQQGLHYIDPDSTHTTVKSAVVKSNVLLDCIQIVHIDTDQMTSPGDINCPHSYNMDTLVCNAD